MKVITILAVAAITAGCGSGAPADRGLPDRELAWCLAKPGAVGAIASDAGSGVPAGAQAIADEGIYDDAGRWAFYDAWDEPTYRHHCAAAYVQFDGADDEVDLAILEPAARVPSPEPTGNIGTAELRDRAAALVPRIEEAGVALVLAIQAADTGAMNDAAAAVRAITVPEWDALTGAVAEPCYEDAGAAYGMTIFNWDAAANNVNRFLDEADSLLLELAVDFATEAATSAAAWRDLDAVACR